MILLCLAIIAYLYYYHGHHIGILSEREIKKEIARGGIVLYDPDRDCSANVQNCSIDITLGSYYYRNESDIPYLNPWCAEHVHNYWGSYKEATAANEKEQQLYHLNEGEKFILLSPGESILGHTQEFVGGVDHITCMVKARSSLGRSNITICRDAGYGDISYYNRFTLEISNHSTTTVILPVGRRIGQLVFFYTGYPDQVYQGKYQSSLSLSELVSSWSPEKMLPQGYRDVRPAC